MNIVRFTWSQYCRCYNLGPVTFYFQSNYWWIVTTTIRTTTTASTTTTKAGTTSTTTSESAITENKLAILRTKLEQMKSRPDVDPKVELLLKMLNETMSTPKGKDLEILNLMMEMMEKLQKQADEKIPINIESSTLRHLGVISEPASTQQDQVESDRGGGGASEQVDSSQPVSHSFRS